MKKVTIQKDYYEIYWVNLMVTLLCTLTVSSSLYNHLPEQKFDIASKSTQYIIRVEFPSFIKNIPTLYGYYKGYRVEFDNNLCIIADSKAYDNFIIVITEQVHHKSEGNNIKYLQRLEDKRCRLFYLTPEYNRWDPTCVNWLVEEEDSKNLPLRLPESAFVLLFNPDYVKVPVSHKPTNKHILSKELIYLPTIVVSSTISQKKITKSSTYALLASLDANAIHRQPKKELKQEQAVLMSVSTSQR
jgi:hypothetical protein